MWSNLVKGGGGGGGPPAKEEEEPSPPPRPTAGTGPSGLPPAKEEEEPPPRPTTTGTGPPGLVDPPPPSHRPPPASITSAAASGGWNDGDVDEAFEGEGGGGTATGWDDSNHYDDDLDDDVDNGWGESDPNGQKHARRDDDNNNQARRGDGGGGIPAAGGGIQPLLGRFARFLEHVTKPDDEDEDLVEYENDDDPGDGWDDDEDDVDDIDLDNSESFVSSYTPGEPPRTPPSSSSTTGRTTVREAANEIASAVPPPPPPPPPMIIPEGSVTPQTAHRSTVGAFSGHSRHQGPIALVDQTPPMMSHGNSDRITERLPDELMLPRTTTPTLAPASGTHSMASSLRVLAEPDDCTRDTGPVPRRGGRVSDNNNEDNNSYASSGIQTELIFDNENEVEFMPVVDHTPRDVKGGSSAPLATSSSAPAAAVPPLPLSRQNSLAVQPGTVVDDDRTGGLDLYGDDDDDEDGWDMDDADLDELPAAEGHNTAGVSAIVVPGASNEEWVVDHTPDEIDPPGTGIPALPMPHRSPYRHTTSTGVLSSKSMGGSIADVPLSLAGGDIMMDDNNTYDADTVNGHGHHLQFGPVVDHTPSVVGVDHDHAEHDGKGRVDDGYEGGGDGGGSVSVAVQAPDTNLEQDYQDDDAMDETLFGDSTVGGVTAATGGDPRDGAAPVGIGWDQEYDDLVGLDDDDDDPDDGLDNETLETTESASHPARRTKTGAVGDARGADDAGGHVVVDHTPDQEHELMSRITFQVPDPSVVVLMERDDLTRDTGNGVDEDVYDDENEENYGPVVDLTPTTPRDASNLGAASQSMVSGANSTAVQAGELYEDIQQDDAMDDTAFGGGDGDTTIKEGWDHDDEDDDGIQLGDDDFDDMALTKGPLERSQETKQVAMVDHTPSEMGSPPLKVNDPSVDVLNSTSTKDDGDSAAGNEFGLVVDHTPVTPANSSSVPRSDSVVVQVQDLDTVDETYADGDDDEEEDGGDTVTLDIPVQFRSPEAQLVDFVPNPPDSRYGDGSTMVAADLSEVLSEVDDMAPEEGNYGPVVDVTPPNHPVVPPAGSPSAAESVAANSTAVVAPASVTADDLDGDPEGDADDEDGNRADDATWGLQGEAPNPQSGNEEPEPEPEEPLVDFLPPVVSEAETADQESSVEGRGPWSEATVGGGQSLLQALAMDPKEDDFGPVVDLTPMPRPSEVPHSGHSLASTATQVTASECRALDKEDTTDGAATEDLEQGKVIVDNLPRSQGRFPIDSTGSVLGSHLAEDEEEDEYGPVVDHLPTPRASLAPSRGGSTVDALATVSEVDTDDDDGGDAWDEDIDVSEGGVSDRSALQRAVATSLAFRRTTDHERNVSVRFDIAVGDSEGSTSEGLTQTHFFDPEMGSSHSADDSQFYGASSGEVRGSPEPAAESLAKAFAEADTPPSTPYRRPSITDSSLPVQYAVGCPSCQDASTTECPCIRRLLEHNDVHAGSLMGTMRTTGGEEVRINISQLLQDEMTKRLLVEKEVESLRSEVDVHRLDRSLASTKEAELEALNEVLQNEKASLQRQVEQLQSEAASNDDERETLKDELNTSLQSLSDAEQKKSVFSAREAALEAQIAQLKKSLEVATEQLVSDNDVAAVLVSIQSDLSAKSGECEELNSQLMQLQLRWQESESHRSNLQQRVEQLSEQLRLQNADSTHAIESLSLQLEQNQRELASAQSDLETVASLRASVRALSSERDDLLGSVTDLNRRREEENQQFIDFVETQNAAIRSLEAAAKSDESEKQKLLADLSRQRSLVEKSEALATELLSVANERDGLQQALAECQESVASLKQLIAEHRTEHEATESTRVAEITSLAARLTESDEAVRKLESERLSLVNALQESRNAMSSLQQRLETRETEFHTSEVRHQDEVVSLHNQITEKSEIIGRLESKNRTYDAELQTARKEKLELEEELRRLQCTHQTVLEEAERLRHALNDEQDQKQDYVSSADSLRTQVAQLTADMQRVEGEHKKSRSHLATLGKTMERKEAEMKALTAKTNELNAVVERVTSDLSSVTDERDRLQRERDDIAQSVRDAEGWASQELELNRTRHQEEVRQLYEKVNSLETSLTRAAEELETSRRSTSELARARDDLTRRCAELEHGMAHSHEEVRQRANQQTVEHQKKSTALQEQLQHATNELAEHRRNADRIESEYKNLSERCRQLESQLMSSTESSSSRLEEVSRSYEARISALQEENSQLAGQVEELSAVQCSLQGDEDELNRLRDEHALLTEENEEVLVQLGLFKQQLDQYEEQVRVLQEEVVARDELVGRVGELSEENATLTSAIERLEEELRFLATEKNRVEEATMDQDEASRVLRDRAARLEQELRGAQHTIRRLEDQIRRQHEEFEAQRDHMQSTSLQDANQVRRIQELERECAAKDEGLVRHAEELSWMRDQVQGAQDQRSSWEEALRTRDLRIHELQVQYDDALAQLNAVTEQLQGGGGASGAEEQGWSFESAVEDEILDRGAGERVTNTSDADAATSHAIIEYEKRIMDLESELNKKDLLVTRLEGSVRELQFEAEAGQSASSLMHIPDETTTSADREVEGLQRQLDEVSRELELARSRAAEVESELNNVRRELAQAQLELQSPPPTPTAAASTLRPSLSHDSTADVESLRSHIVSLAVALERSETRRADAITRLQTERENNARSLKRLSESVKRYYHTVSSNGDA